MHFCEEFPRTYDEIRFATFLELSAANTRRGLPPDVIVVVAILESGIVSPPPLYCPILAILVPA